MAKVPRLADYGHTEIGSWMVGDPSSSGFKSFMVAKFNFWKHQLDDEWDTKFFEMAEHLMKFAMLPILIATFAKLAKDVPDGS